MANEYQGKTTEAMAEAARKVVQEYINRSAAQHQRFMREAAYGTGKQV
jgi:hypothetical protein